MGIRLLSKTNSLGFMKNYPTFYDAESEGGHVFSGDLEIELLFEGEDGDTTTSDSSGNNHTLTFNGGAEIDTAIKKNGNSSLLCNGSNAYINTELSSAFNFYNKSFTLEFWFYIPDINMNTSNQYGLFCIQRSSKANEYCRFWCDNERFWGDVNYTTVITIDNGSNGGAWKPDAGWHHFEFNRDINSNVWRLFLDGTLKDINLANTDFANENHDINIGHGVWNVYYFYNSAGNGQIDDFKIYVGDVLHKENFTPN